MPIPELRWAGADVTSGQQDPQPSTDSHSVSGFGGSDSGLTQKARHRGFQSSIPSANWSKSTVRRVEAGSTAPRSQYPSLQQSHRQDASGATAHIDAALKRSLAAASRITMPERDLSVTITNVHQTLAPETAPTPASMPATPPATSAATPRAPHSAVEDLPRSSLDEVRTGLYAVDMLRERLRRPAQPFPAQVDIDDTPPLPGMRPRSQLIYDEGKEAHRSWRRYVYDFDYWANDRSAARFFFAMLHLPATRILRDVLAPTLLVAAIAVLRCTPAAHAAFSATTEAIAAALPGALRNFCGAMGSVISGTPVELTAGFVGLLVAFRANNAATRFDEARKQLATMLNATRDSVRLAIATLPAGAVQAKASFARWVIASFLSLQCQLRIDDDLQEEVGGLLTDDEQQLLFSSEHPVRSPVR